MEISKALVVDDSRLARVALSKLLGRRGVDVDTADCGEEALDYLAQTSPDVVFIDYMMPDMDGFQAAQAIRRLPGGEFLPLVMYTSQDSPEDRQRARELGIQGFLVKPTSDEGLDTVLEDLRAYLATRPDRRADRAAVSEPLPMDGPEAGDLSAELQAHYSEIAPDVVPEPAPEPAPPVEESALTAQQVRGIAEEVARRQQDRTEQRWLQQLEQNERRWEAELRQIREQMREAAEASARAAARESVEQFGRDSWATMERFEQELRETAADTAHRAARDAVRTAAQEQPAAPDPEALLQSARDAAAQVVDRALAERSGPLADQELAMLAGQALEQAVGDLGQTEAFRDQVIATVNEHGVPLLKNRLDAWVREQAGEAARAAVSQMVEQQLERVVREAVTASAEAAAREADRLYRRWRMLWVGTTAVLAAGLILVLAMVV
ncbi:MAG: response regulator [Ectothiorhodospiraceae bacterium]|nr:response regulator [Ectothiorhodospiraceae bacterium]